MTSGRRRGAMVPPTETLEHELYRLRRQQQYRAFAALQPSLDYAVAVLDQDADDMLPEQCKELELVFQDVRCVVQGSLAALELPDMALGARPYTVLLKLWSLHRTLLEAQVLVGSVRALCERGCLSTDFTGSYWHLRHYLVVVFRMRRELMRLLGIEVLSPGYAVRIDAHAHRVFSVAASA